MTRLSCRQGGQFLATAVRSNVYTGHILSGRAYPVISR
jgi:hypothetical protein